MSKLILYDWRCQSCEQKHEALEKSDVRTRDCPECGGEAIRLISAPRLDPKMGLDPDMPTAYDQWQKTNRQKVEQDKKFHENHGTDKKHHSYGS